MEDAVLIKHALLGDNAMVGRELQTGVRVTESSHRSWQQCWDGQQTLDN